MVFIIMNRISKFINGQHGVVTMLLDECPENLGLISGKGKDLLFTAAFFVYSFSRRCVY
jgi:hypothetical protein